MADEFPSVEKILGQISVATETNHFHALLAQLKRPLNVANFAFHGLFIPGRIHTDRLLLTTYEPDWIRRYVAMDYFRADPVEVCTRNSISPLDWDSVKFHSEGTSAFFSEAEHYGVGKNGISIPLDDRRVGRALFTVTTHMQGRKWEEFKRRELPLLRRIGEILQKRLAALATATRAAPAFAPLTSREQTALELYVAGYETKQIAAAMHVSDTAVREHLKSICTKLGAINPRQAGYIAIAQGVIDTSLIFSRKAVLRS